LLSKQALEEEGFKVDTFNDPVDTLKNFKPRFYDLAILDIVLPNMDGIKLYDELKKVDPKVNVCFLTASEKHRDYLNKNGYSTELFLYKPISILDLIKEVKKGVCL
jgi:two-component system alkaline phosphatase synthesis response regulator PhoP